MSQGAGDGGLESEDGSKDEGLKEQGPSSHFISRPSQGGGDDEIHSSGGQRGFLPPVSGKVAKPFTS